MAELLNLYKDSRLTYKVNVTDILEGYHAEKAIFTLKRKVEDADAQALLQIEITSTPSAVGQILNDGSITHIAVLEFVITEDDLDGADVGRAVSGVKVILDNGSAYIVPESIRTTMINYAMVEAAT